jgi:hypothetical protein
MLAAFVIVFGFVTAGFIATVSSIYQNSNGDIILSLDTPLSAIKGFLLCMFVGPYILAKNTAMLWLGQKISGLSFIACLFVSILWSFCIGIVAIQSLIGFGLL